MLRFIIIPIAIMVGYLLLLGMWNLFFPKTRDQGKRGEDLGRLKGSDMVLDPNCKTYLPKERARSATIGGETVYFCSQACQDKYQFNKEKQEAGSSGD